jgi:hypothetical protein
LGRQAMMWRIALTLALVACGGVERSDARAANALAVASNAALPFVVDRYRNEQLEQLDSDAGEIETRSRVIEVRHQWAPVWLAWESYRVAFGVYATALEQADSDGAGAALARMGAAACAFRASLPRELAPKLPALPVRCPR